MQNIINKEFIANDYNRFNDLNKVVDQRLFKLKNFLLNYKEDLSFHKRHEVIGAIKELVILRDALTSISIAEEACYINLN